ncbi:MAG: DUF1572 family protein [Phycisphaerales bacterium]|jgi:hypothetical protein
MTDATYSDGLAGGLVRSWLEVFERQKAFAEHAFDQLDDAGFFASPGEGLNSVAIIAQHLAGNLKSRWTDFLTSDGEKEWRDRDAEFVPPAPTAEGRSTLMQEWELGWRTLFEAVRPLTPADLDKTITIRGAPHAVHAAVARQLDHYGFHIGQINVIARMHVGADRWRWFTIPPGGTKDFNDAMRRRNA